MITLPAAAKMLLDQDDIVILAHQKPDGDTLGCCFGLLYALEAAGKRARVECGDGYPDHYRVIYGDYEPEQFEARFVVACDVAGRALLGGLADTYPNIDLCVDHHKSNGLYAAQTLLDPKAAAAAELVYRLIREMGVAFDTRVATALFTGITTDTGCFRFGNVTSDTMRIAAGLIDLGANHILINKLMFDSKSRGRMEVEKFVLQSLEYFRGDRCAMVSLPADIHERYGVTEADLDGISALPRRIEGVLCGITIRERSDGGYRVSLRCDAPLDASKICAEFGGGGHTGAGGCTMSGSLDDVKARLRDALERALP